MTRRDQRGARIQIPNLPEPNIAVQGQSHEEHKGGVEEDQSCLANVAVVYKNSQLTAQNYRLRVMVLTNSDQQSGE